jgi:hypothetical protein
MRTMNESEVSGLPAGQLLQQAEADGAVVVERESGEPAFLIIPLGHPGRASAELEGHPGRAAIAGELERVARELKGHPGRA